MKLGALLTSLIFVFGWTTELLAQFVPVIAKQRSVQYLAQSDGTEVEVEREEGTYFRSSSGSVLDTMARVTGENQGGRRSTLMDSSTRRTYALNHCLKEATLKQVRPEPFRPVVFRPDRAVDEGVVAGLDCLAVPVLSPRNPEESIGKVWWAKKAKLRVKTETTFGRGRQVRELYDIRFAEPEPSVFKIPANYKIDDTTWKEEKVAQVYAVGTPRFQALAGTEAEVFRSVRRGALPDVAGQRLDGVEERLSDYRGRIVLLDFWATWCGPCVAALPKLRELVARLPADRFALVGISVDEELETVTRFIEDEPMPWTNWHVGEGSDLERLLRIRGFPTYVLADENGRILARTNGLVPPFTALIEKAVDHLGEFGSTRRLDVESMAMSDAFDEMTYPAVAFGAAGVLLLLMGLRGLVTRQPFLFSGRWILVFTLAIFLGMMVPSLSLPSSSSQPLQMMDWLPFLISLLFFLIMAVVLWLQTRGYQAFAVTGKSFRDGLLAALEKLQLPYEESLASIRLPSVDAELQVAVQSWMGSAQIKVRPGRHGPLLKKIVQAMKEHFRNAAVETNRISCVFYLIFGIVILGIFAALAAIRQEML